MRGAPHRAAFVLCAVLLLSAAEGQHSVCTLATLQDINDILPICCGSTSAPDCSAGMPARCAPECAELLVPFWQSCSTLIQFMGTDALGVDVHAVGGFIEPCEQSLALMSGAESCEAGTGRGGPTDLHSWVDDVNGACCMQNGINVCRGGETVPWLCAFIEPGSKRLLEISSPSSSIHELMCGLCLPRAGSADCALTFIPFMEQ